MKKTLPIYITLFCAITASACPVCSSPRATQVRHYLFGPELTGNMFALVLPFLIFAAVTVCVYYYDFPFNKKQI
jgi:hypothetical protein